MNAEQYCQEQAAASGSSFYYSFLFLPARQRRAITALYAFCREVDDVVDECSDPSVARSKLAWWRDEVQRVYSGLPQHPVGIALADCLGDFKLEQAYLLAIIDGMEMDIERARYQNFDELEDYCYHVAGVVGLLAIEIFGYSDPRTRDYAVKLGLAFQLTNILRDVGEDATRNRIYIPLDELKKFGVSENDLLQGRDSDAMRELFKFQAQRAEACYEEAFTTLPECDRFKQASGIVMASIYHELLRRIVKRDYRLFGNKVRLSPLRKLWIAWRTYRREQRRFKKYSRDAG